VQKHTRNTSTSLVGQLEGNLEHLDAKLILKRIRIRGCGLDSSGCGQEAMTGSCELGIEPSWSRKSREFPDGQSSIGRTRAHGVKIYWPLQARITIPLKLPYGFESECMSIRVVYSSCVVVIPRITLFAICLDTRYCKNQQTNDLTAKHCLVKRYLW
jgi:hypothetical protein